MKKPVIAAAALLFFLSQSLAQPAMGGQEQEPPQRLPDSAVVAERGGAVLTLGDMRAKLRASLPASKRDGFFSDGAKVALLIDELLAARQLADVARENGLHLDPELRAEVELYEIDLLARHQIRQYMAALEEPDYEILARERYLANKADYATPESRDVRHILIRTRAAGRSEQQSREIAAKVRDLLMSGGDFDELFEEYSEDGNPDLAGWVRGIKDDGSFDPAFVTATLHILEKPGDVSEPVLSDFGYHVIRLEGITPARDRSYEEVKDEIIAAIRQEYRRAARTTYVNNFTSEELKLNEETMKKLSTQE